MTGATINPPGFPKRGTSTACQCGRVTLSGAWGTIHCPACPTPAATPSQTLRRWLSRIRTR